MKNELKQTREAMDISQEELSKKSGVSRTIISGLENGKIERVTNITLEKLANALGKKVSDIFFK